MADESLRKNAAMEYARRINAGDLEGVLELFADDVVVEDPVGSPPVRGKEKLRERIAWAIESGVHEVPGRMVTSMDGRTVVVPSLVKTVHPAKMTYKVIGISEIGEDGLTHSLRAHWGITDTYLDDEPRLTGVEHALAVAERLIETVRLSEGGGSA
ncbi:nuclear transport factor 2 family protein [Actinomadura roseirufa]|uniref:nuclear transport factor 2 family protein n=1 Tax=Actinomadura roseirufa TaxID=2094049 RepID=UPI001041581E|nr:nuclear transport factor 2 family protein [Actinomadura roseirufa]